MLSGIKGLRQKHQSSMALWPATLTCLRFFAEGFQFMVPSLYLSWSTKEQQKKGDMILQDAQVPVIHPIYLSEHSFLCMPGK